MIACFLVATALGPSDAAQQRRNHYERVRQRNLESEAGSKF